MKISICLCLCLSKKNQQFLSKLLNSINNMVVPLDCKINLVFVLHRKFTIQKNTVKNKINSKKIPINFIFHSKVGIPYARNTFLNYSRKKEYDFIGFIDDDCLVDKYWLFNMVKIIKSNKPDVIGGPQYHQVKSGKIRNYYNLIEPKNKHKQEVKWLATNNVLFKKKIIIDNNLQFEKKLNKIGGSDQLFFKKLSYKGYKLLWNQKAYVTECNSEERNKLVWFINRNFRYGYAGCFIDKSVYGLKKGIIINLVKIVFLFVSSFLNLYFLFFKKKRAKFIFGLSRLIGRLYSLLGFKINKYY